MRFPALLRAALALTLLVPACLATGAVPTPTASILELPPLPGDESSGANDINAAGVVVGRSYTLATEDEFLTRRAVEWRNGQVRPLPMPPGVTESAAFAIDDLGRVAGEAGTLNGTLHAYRLVRSRLQFLGPFLPGIGTFIGEMNNRAEGVGGTDNEGGNDAALLWVGNQPALLPTFPDRSSATAIAINFNRESIGIAYNKDGDGKAVDRRAALWKGTRLVALPQLPGGTESAAEDNNNQGQIVGWSRDAAGVKRAVFWQNQRITALPVPDPSVDTIAYIDNNTGLIIGVSEDSEEEFRTLLWVRGQLFILNDLLPPDSGWTNLDPFVVNDRGQFVGRGRLNGLVRAFLITIQRG